MLFTYALKTSKHKDPFRTYLCYCGVLWSPSCQQA